MQKEVSLAMVYGELGREGVNMVGGGWEREIDLVKWWAGGCGPWRATIKRNTHLIIRSSMPTLAAYYVCSTL